MKLYTEEQVMNALKLAHSHITSLQNIIDRHLTPIELPSDEEIDAHVEEDFLNADGVHKYSEEIQLLMKAMCKAGMQCMRDNIKGGNK